MSKKKEAQAQRSTNSKDSKAPDFSEIIKKIAERIEKIVDDTEKPLDSLGLRALSGALSQLSKEQRLSAGEATSISRTVSKIDVKETKTPEEQRFIQTILNLQAVTKDEPT